MKIYSPNMLKTYKTCPKKYELQYIESLKVPVNIGMFEKGKKIHALANYYLSGVNISRIEQSLDKNEMKIWQILLSNNYFQKEYLKSEFQLSCRVGNFWIGGRLDAVVCDGGDYYILDYKTGSVPKNPENDYQTMVYLLCLDKYLSKYDSLSFVYLSLKENTSALIKFDGEKKTLYENSIKTICSAIETDTLYSTNSSNCSNCEYSNLCSAIYY